MSVRFHYFIPALLLAGSAAFACGNSWFDSPPLPWAREPTEDAVDSLRARLDDFPSEHLLEFKEWYRERLGIAPGSPAEPQEDEYLALRDMLSGNYTAAIERLHAMEASTPGAYSTAANLGTAYELAGDNEKALEWISKGIERNPDSHYGTEWLHAEILKAKITMERDPNYLREHHIAPVPEVGVPFYKVPLLYGNKRVTWLENLTALQYQLSERMLFVKPEDPVVADLLYSYGRLFASSESWNRAGTLLELARDYGYHDSAELDARIAEYRLLHRNKMIREWTIRSVIALITLFLAYRFAWSLYRFHKLIRRRGNPIFAAHTFGVHP